MFLTGALSCWTREYLPWSVHSLFIQSITLPTLTCLPLTEPRRHHIPDYTQSDGEKTCLDHSCWSWHTRSTAHTCCLQWHNHDAITHQPDALSNISKLSVLVTAPEAGCEVRLMRRSNSSYCVSLNHTGTNPPWCWYWASHFEASSFLAVTTDWPCLSVPLC